MAKERNDAWVEFNLDNFVVIVFPEFGCFGFLHISRISFWESINNYRSEVV